MPNAEQLPFSYDDADNVRQVAATPWPLLATVAIGCFLGALLGLAVPRDLLLTFLSL